jgi:hypothetical protein
MLGYLDAGSFMILWAALAGGLAGVAVLVRMYWHRILGVFSKKHRVRADEARAQLVGSADADD